MGVENKTAGVTEGQMRAFLAGLRSFHRGPTFADVEGIDEPMPEPIDTSWMREENWDLGRLAPAA